MCTRWPCFNQIKWNETQQQPYKEAQVSSDKCSIWKNRPKHLSGWAHRESGQTRGKVSALEDEWPSLGRREKPDWKQKWVNRKSLWSAAQDLFSWQFSLQPWSSDGSGQFPLGLEMFLTSIRLPVPALGGHDTGAHASQVLHTEFALSTEFTGLCQTLCV